MERAEVGVLEEADEVSLGRLLEGKDGGGLEPEVAVVGLVVLGDLANKALEGDLADEQIGALLVLSDLAESTGTRPEAVRLLLQTTDGRVSFPRRLRCEL